MVITNDIVINRTVLALLYLLVACAATSDWASLNNTIIGGGTAGDTREFPWLVQGSQGKVSYFPGSNFRPK
jgi:hypothetical protein